MVGQNNNHIQSAHAQNQLEIKVLTGGSTPGVHTQRQNGR